MGLSSPKTLKTSMLNNNAFDLKNFLKTLPEQPGVYQMINAESKVIYVGKARNLKKRVQSYFSRQLEVKTQAMVAKISRIEIIVTSSENEALLLEYNLIKTHKPRYNILLKDDKSYPYLFLSTKHAFPRLDYCRGIKKTEGEYFGPFANLYSVRESLALVQKLFQIRPCKDSYFAHRSRPCLQYQIQRCTGPCVGLVSEVDYKKQVNRAVLFLQGKSDEIIAVLQKDMEEAASAQHYEEAAKQRDKIRILRRLQQQQHVIGDEASLDIVGVYQQRGEACICVLQIRGGRLLGSRNYFPKTALIESEEALLAAFLPHYYLGSMRALEVPNQIVCTHSLSERAWIEAALSAKLGREFRLIDQPGDQRLAHSREWVRMAKNNAAQALRQNLAEASLWQAKFAALQQLLDLPSPIVRMECFDISHTRGEATVASCVVFDEQGPSNKAYRHYNIHDITPGDDYAAMRQALTRRFHAKDASSQPMPDVIIIDGGKGQLQVAHEVLAEQNITGIVLLGVAKGPERKPGEETLWLDGRLEPLCINPIDPVFHLLQHIRDEAHRFAITAHRAKRAKTRRQSVLLDIEGVGALRRQRLLTHFGGLQELKRASVAEIARVPGIGPALAEIIFKNLHQGKS